MEQPSHACMSSLKLQTCRFTTAWAGFWIVIKCTDESPLRLRHRLSEDRAVKQRQRQPVSACLKTAADLPRPWPLAPGPWPLAPSSEEQSYGSGWRPSTPPHNLCPLQTAILIPALLGPVLIIVIPSSLLFPTNLSWSSSRSRPQPLKGWWWTGGLGAECAESVTAVAPQIEYALKTSRSCCCTRGKGAFWHSLLLSKLSGSKGRPGKAGLSDEERSHSKADF